MKKNTPKLIASILGISLALGMSLSLRPNDVKETKAIGNYSTDAATYYNGITATSGQQLAAQLHDLITSTHRYYTSYDDNGKNLYQQNTDQYYENGEKVNGYINEFYSGVKWPNAWSYEAGSTTGGYNREHCWCQSNSVNSSGTQMWGTTGGGSDMHHIRPAETRLNSTRNNHPYGEISNRDSYKVYAKFGTNTTYAHGGYCNDKGDVFEPLDSKKGDVARIMFYVYIHYNSYTISSIFGSYGTTNGNGSSSYFSSSLLSLTKIMKPSTESAAIEMLLNWNNLDPVDELEQRRNEQVAIYQGNRNPFIDNSNYANMIWGDGSTPATPTVNSVSVSPTSLNIDLNGTTTGNLTATVNVSNGAATTVNWTSSNENVATVSSTGVVTAQATGTCNITATSTVNPAKSASCSVTVVDTTPSGGGGETHEEETSGSIAASSGSLSGWTASGTGSAYADGAVKFDSSGDNVYCTTLFTGDVSSGMKSLDITINGKINGTPSDTNSYKVEAIDADGNILATQTKTGANIFTTSYSNVVFSFNTGLTGCAGIKITYVNKGTGNLGVKSVSWEITYETSGSTTTKELSSISLNTSNTPLLFTVGDTFDYDGLVVTAHYSDGTESIVAPTSVSTPDMSTAGYKTVVVSYTESGVTKNELYEINVEELSASEISASTSKIFHPGDVITKDDIAVYDDLDNEITDFTFAYDGYQIKYSDTLPSGDARVLTFEDAITYDSMTCDLDINVDRKDYEIVAPLTDTITREDTGINATNYTSWSNLELNTYARYSGQSAGVKDEIYDYIQLRSNNSNSGIVTTYNYEYSASIAHVAIDWVDTSASTWQESGNNTNKVLNIYGKTASQGAYTSPTDLYNASTQGTLIGTIAYGTSTELYINDSNYIYIGIRSNKGAIYLNSISITYGGLESTENVSNYIMYEDTDNQCTTKLSSAIEKLNNMSQAEKELFWTSNDYVIATARTRLSAWVRHEGKTLSFINNTFSMTSQSSNSVLNEMDVNTSNTLIVIIIITSISMISVCLILKRKRSHY